MTKDHEYLSQTLSSAWRNWMYFCTYSKSAVSRHCWRKPKWAPLPNGRRFASIFWRPFSHHRITLNRPVLVATFNKFISLAEPLYLIPYLALSGPTRSLHRHV